MMTTRTLLSLAALTCAASLMSESASAQMMGNGPYSFPARNNSFAAQAQITQRLNSNGGSGSGMDALSQYVYNSSSTSIGNYNQVTVGDNSSADVDSDQDNTGNQGAEATTDIKNIVKTVNQAATQPNQ